MIVEQDRRKVCLLLRRSKVVVERNWQVEADRLRHVPLTGPPTMIIVLGIGQLTSQYEFNNMASWPYRTNVVFVNSFAQLTNVESRLTNAICAGIYHQ